MTRELENYLMERYIPLSSLEANSIQEGYDFATKRSEEWIRKVLFDYFGEVITNILITDFYKVMNNS